MYIKNRRMAELLSTLLLFCTAEAFASATTKT
jgi:hypothetical protein